MMQNVSRDLSSIGIDTGAKFVRSIWLFGNVQSTLRGCFHECYGINDEASSAHLDLRNLFSLFFSLREAWGRGKVGKSQFDCLYVAKKSFLRC